MAGGGRRGRDAKKRKRKGEGRERVVEANFIKVR